MKVEEPPVAVRQVGAHPHGAAAAAAFLRRTKAADRAAGWVISVGGIVIIAAVFGIGVFLLVEIAPLFSGARVSAAPAPAVQVPAARAVFLHEHQDRALVIGADPAVQAIDLASSGSPHLVPLAGVESMRVSAVSRALHEPVIACGTEAGSVWIGSVQWHTAFEGAQQVVRLAVEPEAVVQAVPGHRVTHVAYRRAGPRAVLATVADGAALVVTRVATQRPPVGLPRRSLDGVGVPTAPFGRPTALLLNEAGTQLFAATSAGKLIRWRVPADGPLELMETAEAVPGGAVTAMAFLLGGRSIAVGGSDGSVATWSLVREETVADGWRLTRIHRFPAHPSGVALIAPSPRDKGFITASTDGTARLQHMTSERTLAEWAVGEAPLAIEFAPKADGALLVGASGALHHRRIENPHPELSWQALFGKVWYEGYQGPDYVWQSTGGTDDFEPKFSLVPLIFGTLKGTLYALLFAIPLSVLGALYCSQFLHHRLRHPLKSAIEMMAALPSVVLGFVAGVILAPLVQRHVTAVLCLPVIVPLVSVAGMSVCAFVLPPPVRTLLRRHDFWILTAWVLIGVAASVWLGPWIERVAFGGAFEHWLIQATGTRYDQRNALVVGWVMGFAVIPVIFTMCEDAFSSVPRHLIGASLACGASPWQTAWRVVLPAAGSGVFSGIMVGFGRAVGETMIVLMATGNTPVLDWSLFNGFRTLSANIAVEIPEAPQGGTLYRLLFLSALLLFIMTSLVNTAAELIRLRLRTRLKGL